jgi:hypothetical protein
MTQTQKVKKNALLLDKLITKFIAKHSNKYVTFFNGQFVFSENLGLALKKGDKFFGENSGFVVRKIRKEIPKFSNLVQI